MLNKVMRIKRYHIGWFNRFLERMQLDFVDDDLSDSLNRIDELIREDDELFVVLELYVVGVIRCGPLIEKTLEFFVPVPT
jgi:hypothetical protein